MVGVLLGADKVQIPGKAVLGLHHILPTLQPVFAVQDLAHEGEKNGGVPVPHRGIGAPEPFATGLLVPDPAQLGAAVGDLQAQDFIFQNMHGKLSLFVFLSGESGPPGGTFPRRRRTPASVYRKSRRKDTEIYGFWCSRSEIAPRLSDRS